jgi:2-succinyl-5-enolpyruvyl-6-hydroxy-3-cyclohexene-1-carboxylate synthase
MTRRRTESPATDFSVALLGEFVALGLRDIVVCPGSRSQALALAAAEFERAGLLRLRVRIDERSAGFLALGLAVESGMPVAIVTTSGTAVANLHPAVLEAHHAGVPLILLTADRPETMRGIGANQTTDQPGMFGTAVQQTFDVGAPTGEPGEAEAAAELARTAWRQRGPVHLNLAFMEPLSAPFTLPTERRSSAAEGGVSRPSAADAAAMLNSGFDSPTEPPARASRAPDYSAGAQRPPSAGATQPSLGVRVSFVPGTVVVAGTGAGPRAEEVARELGAPLLAEVTSGAHFGPNLVVAYRELLAAANFGDRISRVIVFGHPTLSREIPQLIQREGVETVVVRGPAPDDYNPGHRVAAHVDELLVDGEPGERSWAGRWVAASRALIGDEDAAADVTADAGSHARAELAAVRAPVTRRALVDAVWRASWPHDRLVVGASRLIRELDKVAPGKRIEVHANRGLAGIDGTISTGMGIALAQQSSGRLRAGDQGTTRVLLGDLAFLHDVGGLAIGVGEPRPRIQVIVGNDGGGTIFDGLEVGASAEASAFDRVLLTAQQVSIEALAVAFGWEYRRVENRGQLDQALTASTGPTIVEVPLPR